VVPANALGLGVSDVAADKLKELGVKGAVQVDSVDGLAASAGLRAGDIITQLNSSEIGNAKQFNEAVAKLDPKKDVAVLVRRGEASRFIIIRR
jgi:serine protease Do